MTKRSDFIEDLLTAAASFLKGQIKPLSAAELGTMQFMYGPPFSFGAGVSPQAAKDAVPLAWLQFQLTPAQISYIMRPPSPLARVGLPPDGQVWWYAGADDQGQREEGYAVLVGNVAVSLTRGLKGTKPPGPQWYPD